MAKTNYKVDANIGFDRQYTAWFASLFDTGHGASFIRKSMLPNVAWSRIKSVKPANSIRDANNRTVNNCAVIGLIVDIGFGVKHIRFNVVESLVTEVIIGCDFCDKHVEAISSRKQEVDLADGATVPVI